MSVKICFYVYKVEVAVLLLPMKGWFRYCHCSGHYQ